MLFFVIFLIIIIAVVCFFGIVIRNNLVVLDENCKNALAQIETNLTSRFDALTGLLDVVKGYAKHEMETLTQVIGMRNPGHSLKDIQANENILTEAMGKLMVVQEQYPELKADAHYTKLMDDVNSYEEKVRSTRMVYNDCITKFNRKVRSFPTCIFAGFMGFTVKDEYIQADEKHKEMPSMK